MCWTEQRKKFTFSWLGWYGGLRIQNRVSACICIFNVWPYGHSGHLVIYPDIYCSSGVTADTFSPGHPVHYSECQNVQIILSCHLVPSIATPGAKSWRLIRWDYTAHLVQIWSSILEVIVARSGQSRVTNHHENWEYKLPGKCISQWQSSSPRPASRNQSEMFAANWNLSPPSPPARPSVVTCECLADIL